MSKIIATLAILALFVCGAYSTTTSQKSTVISTYLNNVVTEVYGVNTTDATLWGTVPYNQVIFGPGSTNSTLYAYGIVSGTGGVTQIIRRTLNAVLVGYGNDTMEAATVGSDATITAAAGLATPTSMAMAVGPGSIAVLVAAPDAATSGKSQVYLIIVPSGSSTATVKTLTTNTLTTTSYSVASQGSIFYEMGSSTFFYSYLQTATGPVNTVYVGGYYASASGVYWAPLAITPATPADTISAPLVGGDNYLNASNIWVVFKDTSAAVPTSYSSKTVKASTTATAGSPSTLVADSAATANVTTYVPVGVWASNYTYGISCSLKAAATAGTTYTVANFYNGSTTGVDSGLDLTSATNPAFTVVGGMLTTGYSLLVGWQLASTESGLNSYTMANFYMNATLNGTSNTLATSLVGPVNVFEDVNGTEWIGWTDTTYTGTTTPTYTYTSAGYLAKLLGQVNGGSSSGNVLTTLMAFVAFCLAAVFAF